MTSSFRIRRVWKGGTAVVIGGGPSLTLQQVQMIGRARLAGGVKVVAVNNAMYVAWWADWLHACDFKWWNEHIQCAQHFKRIRTTLDPLVPPQWRVGLLHNTGKDGFDPNPENCRTGGNGVYQSIHCLIHAGVRKIVLVGTDMKVGPQGRTHWHSGHGGPDVDYATVMAPSFETLVPALKERGVTVVNASPNSALRTFPLVPLETALHGAHR